MNKLFQKLISVLLFSFYSIGLAQNFYPIYEKIMINNVDPENALFTSYILPYNSATVTISAFPLNVFFDNPSTPTDTEVDIKTPNLTITRNAEAVNLNTSTFSNDDLECLNCNSSIKAPAIGNYKVIVKSPNGQLTNSVSCPANYTLINCSGIHNLNYEETNVIISTPNANNIQTCTRNLKYSNGATTVNSGNSMSITCFKGNGTTSLDNFYTISRQ